MDAGRSRAGWLSLLVGIAASCPIAGAQEVIDLLGVDGRAAINIQLNADPFGAAMDRGALLEPAEMKTDSESKEILDQAEQFVKQGRYDLASILWQRVIDESGDQVFTRDEWRERTLQNEYQKYRSVSGDIESTLANLPPEGLVAYRLKADGEARALMKAADPKNRESALAEIVRRFFLSKLGDDAAFELACLKLDRGEFLPAARLLAKIANDYPDPTVRPGEINLRLAAVNARVGEVKLAREILGEMRSQPIPPVPVAVLRMVEQDVEQMAGDRTSIATRIGSWTMPQGGPTRTGLMPAPELEAPEGLIAGWKQGYELTLPGGDEWSLIKKDQQADRGKATKGEDAILQLLNQDPFSGRATAKPRRAATDEEIVEKWKGNGWSPVGQVLMDGGRVFFKTDDRVVCCDAATGELNWFGFRSEYPEDPLSAAAARYRSYGRASGESGDPTGEREVLSFSDMLNQSMSIVGDKLLVVQGRLLDIPEDGDLDDAGREEAAANARMMRFGRGQGATQGRTRDNRLVAIHATNGKVLWMLKAGDMLPDSTRKMAFAGSPVPYGSLIVVPAYEATSLWLFGLDPDTGKVLWKVFLADEAAGQTSVNSPVRVAIDGGEAYVATGAGIVASVDAISGTLNWAVAYPRTQPGRTDPNARNHMHFYGIQRVALDGWDDDTIIPSGNAIVFAASDFNYLAALDRRTGAVIWDTARTPIENEPASEYVLGIADGVVCVAGSEVVRGYRLKGGRFLWEHRLDERSHGRGMLTEAGIYIPLERSILHLSTAEGKVIETIAVETAEDAPPLGNLFTDGENLFSAGFRNLESLRARRAGEAVAGPEEEEPVVVEPAPVKPHAALAAEARKLINDAYDRLAAVRDAEGAVAAGEAFDAIGGKLEEVAGRMRELGEPDAPTRAQLEEQFALDRAVNTKKISKALPRVIEVEEEGGELLIKMIGMQKAAEALPILKAYGIDIERPKVNPEE